MDNDMMQKIQMAFSRGALTSALRNIDIKSPVTWEFSAFSQNGEDGIIDILTKNIKIPNYYFIEIGASDGTENNTSWLALGRKYEGIMIEGDHEAFTRLQQHVLPLNIGVEGLNLFVNLNNLQDIIQNSRHKAPDIFSLDIDGNDYFIAKGLMDMGLRPKVFVVEYNSAYGPENSLTIQYDENFEINIDHHSDYLYYGVSITAWKKLFKDYGYQFITVERRGVNAFFIDPTHFDRKFVQRIKGLDFAENFFQLRKYKANWEQQYQYIKNKNYVLI